MYPSGAKSAWPGCIFVSCTEKTSASSAAKLAAKSWVRQARRPLTFQLMSFMQSSCLFLRSIGYAVYLFFQTPLRNRSTKQVVRQTQSTTMAIQTPMAP